MAEWHCSGLESVWVTIPAKAVKTRHNLHIATVYIPPNDQIPSILHIFMNQLSEIKSQNCNDHFIIAGDFNLPIIDWQYGEPIILRKGS
ncbi:unnamed protein product [Parnassius mnemosyne]|uniref:Endonuclease/exonuclease/phosphatase domain-containing protein n=1 Tax=Parnassius mnemosyne TaxID=213953 RepID=A0AAV1LYG0_9NEOP